MNNKNLDRTFEEAERLLVECERERCIEGMKTLLKIHERHKEEYKRKKQQNLPKGE